MKKIILLCLMAVMVVTTTPVSAAQSVQITAEAKAVLLQELTIKLNLLVAQLKLLLEAQDARIKIEVSSSRVNAELYYTEDPQRGYAGTCTDITKRIYDALVSPKTNMIIKATDVSCFDSQSDFALSIKTSKGYSCADSTGVMRDTRTQATGVTCPVQ